MLRQREPNSFQWRRIHERLDRAIAEAARLYLQRLASRHVPPNPAKWSSELDELRFGREPDYDMPGLPLVYAIKYMPRRVVSIYGSLLSVLGGWYPTLVLDIGSGTGATALALDLLNLPRHINLVGLDPSEEMITFSECSRYRDRVSAHYGRGSTASLVRGSISPDAFDLLVFSACFPYDFDDWGRLSNAIGSYRGRESKMILVVEPGAKHGIVTSFQRQLRSRGWPTVTFCCHDLPELIKDDGLPLGKMLNVWRRLGLDDSSRPRTWWNPPDDRFLVGNPEPVRPCSRSVILRSVTNVGPRSPLSCR